MFDELDDPAGTPRGDLARVLARAAARRRRRAVTTVGSGVALSLVAGLVVLARPAPGTHSLRPLDPSPSATATASPAPSGSATPEPGEPSATATSPAATATPTPEPTYAGPGWDQPDGKPGWSTGFSWCSPAEDGPSRAPASDLRLTAALDQPAFRPGDAVTGTATIHNDGDHPVTVDAYAGGGFDGVLFDAHGKAVDGVFGNDAMAGLNETIPARGTYRYPFRAATSTCGDTSSQDEDLPAGDYTVAPVLAWEHSGGSAGGTWVGERVPVTLDPAAPAPSYGPPPDPSAPCWNDGSDCNPLPATAPCRNAKLPGRDYGADRGLTLSIAPDSGTVRSGTAVAATATITNTGSVGAELRVVNGIDGGVLLGSSGAVASGRRQQSSGPEPLTIAAGAHVTVPVTVQTRACAGDAMGAGVAPGRYDVQAGVYVEGYGWWVASGTQSVLVTP